MTSLLTPSHRPFPPPARAFLALLLALPWQALPALAEDPVPTPPQESPDDSAARADEALRQAGRDREAMRRHLDEALASPGLDGARALERRFGALARALAGGRALSDDDLSFLSEFKRAYADRVAADPHSASVALLSDDPELKALLAELEKRSPAPEGERAAGAEPVRRVSEGRGPKKLDLKVAQKTAARTTAGLADGLDAAADNRRLVGTDPGLPMGPSAREAAPQGKTVERAPLPVGFKAFSEAPPSVGAAPPAPAFTAEEAALLEKLKPAPPSGLSSLDALAARERREALKALADKGPEGAPALFEALRLSVARRASGAMDDREFHGEFRSALFTMLGALGSADAKVLRAAARANPGAVEALVASLGMANAQGPYDSSRALAILERLGADAVPALSKGLAGGLLAPEYRERAAAALARLGPEAAGPALDALLGSLSEGAALVPGRYARNSGVPSELEGLWENSWRLLARFGDAATPGLARLLRDGSPSAKAGALRALAGREGGPRVPYAALDAAAKELLLSDDPQLRRRAAEALAALPPEAAKESVSALADALVKPLKSTSFGKDELDRAVVAALVHLGPAANGAVQQLIDSAPRPDARNALLPSRGSASVREPHLRALAAIGTGDPRAAQYLAAVIANRARNGAGPELIADLAGALRGYGRSGSAALAALADLALDPRAGAGVERARSALTALGRGTPIPALVEQVVVGKTPALRAFSADALRAAAAAPGDQAAYAAFLASRLGPSYDGAARLAALEGLKGLPIPASGARDLLDALLSADDGTADFEQRSALSVGIRSLLGGLPPASRDAAFYARAAAGLSSASTRSRLEAARVLAAGGAMARPHLEALLAALPGPGLSHNDIDINDQRSLTEAVQAAVEAAGPAEPGQVPGLAAHLADDNAARREAALQALGSEGLAQAALGAQSAGPRRQALAALFKGPAHRTLSPQRRKELGALLGAIVADPKENNYQAMQAAKWAGLLGPDGASAGPGLAAALAEPGVRSGPRRKFAGEALVKLDPARAVTEVSKVLESGDAASRRLALRLLAQVEGPESGRIPASVLEPLLSDPEAGTEAALALRVSHPDHPKAGSLAVLAADPASKSRTAALKALAGLPELRPDELLAALGAASAADAAARQAGLEVLARHGAGAEGAVEAAARALSDKDWGPRIAAVEALSSMAAVDPKAAAALVKALDTPSPDLRLKALEALERGGGQDGSLLPALSGWLAAFAAGKGTHADPDSQATFSRARALAVRLAGADSPLGALLDEAGSADPVRRARSAAVLDAWMARGDTAEAARLLASQMTRKDRRNDDGTWDVAVLGAVARQDPEAVAVLAGVLKEDLPITLELAVQRELAGFGAAGAPAVRAQGNIWRTVDVLKDGGPQARAEMFAALADPAVPLKDRLGALGKVGTKGLSDSEAASVRAWLGAALLEPGQAQKVAGFLADSGGPEAFAVLKQGLEATEPSARRESAIALARLPGGVEPSLPGLLDAVAAGSSDQRSRAIAALAAVGPLGALRQGLDAAAGDPKALAEAAKSSRPEAAALALERLVAAARSADADLSFRASNELWRLGAAAATPAVVEALGAAASSKDLDAREEAVRALGTAGAGRQAAADILARALRDEDRGVRNSAAWALAQLAKDSRALDYDGAVKALTALLSDPDSDRVLRRNAFFALDRIGWQSDAARPAIEALLKTRLDQNERFAANEALKHIEADMNSPYAMRRAPPAELSSALESEKDPGRLGVLARSLGALGAGGKDQAPVLERALARLDSLGGDPSAVALARSALLRALVDTDPERALPLLMRSAPDAGAPVPPAKTASLLDTARAALAATPLAALFPGLAPAVPGDAANLAALEKAGQLRWHRRGTVTGPDGSKIEGWQMQWANGALQFEAADGRYWMLAPDGSRAAGNSRTGAVVREDGAATTSFDPATGIFSRKLKGEPYPETEWSPSLYFTGTQGTFKGSNFSRGEGETPRLEGDRLSFYKDGPDGRPVLTGWIELDGQGKKHAYDVLPGGLGLVHNGQDIVLNPSILGEVAEGRLDLSGIPAERLPPEARSAFTAFLKAYPSLNPGLSEAYAGLARRNAEGDTETRAVTGLNIVFDDHDQVYRLHMNVTSRVDSFAGKNLKASQVQHYAEVLRDGTVRVFTVDGAALSMEAFSSDFRSVTRSVPDEAHAAAGRTRFRTDEEKSVIGGRWAQTAMGTPSVVEPPNWALEKFSGGVEVVFSPFQSALYSILGLSTMAQGKIGGALGYKEWEAVSMMSGNQTLGQMKFVQYLDGHDHDLHSYRGGKAWLDAEQGAFVDQYLEAEYRQRRAKQFGVAAFLVRGEQVGERERAGAAAQLLGAGNVPKNYMEWGEEAYKRGDTAGTLLNYGAAGTFILGEAYVEGFGFGAVVTGPLKAAAAARSLTLARALTVGELTAFAAPGVVQVGSSYAALQEAKAKGDKEFEWEHFNETFSGATGLAGMLGGLIQPAIKFFRGAPPERALTVVDEAAARRMSPSDLARYGAELGLNPADLAGLGPKEAVEAINRAHRKAVMAERAHPDLNYGDPAKMEAATERFKQLTGARDSLTRAFGNGVAEPAPPPPGGGAWANKVVGLLRGPPEPAGAKPSELSDIIDNSPPGSKANARAVVDALKGRMILEGVPYEVVSDVKFELVPAKLTDNVFTYNPVENRVRIAVDPYGRTIFGRAVHEGQHAIDFLTGKFTLEEMLDSAAKSTEAKLISAGGSDRYRHFESKEQALEAERKAFDAYRNSPPEVSAEIGNYVAEYDRLYARLLRLEGKAAARYGADEPARVARAIEAGRNLLARYAETLKELDTQKFFNEFNARLRGTGRDGPAGRGKYEPPKRPMPELGTYFPRDAFKTALHPAAEGVYHSPAHSENVAKMAFDFAVARGLGPADARFLYEVALLHDIDPARAPGTPARVPATLEALRADFYKTKSLDGVEGESVLRDRFGWDELKLAKAEALIQRTEFPFADTHPNPSYKGTSPLARYEAMLEALPQAERAFVLREGALLSEYADKSSWYAMEGFEGAMSSVEGLANEINAASGGKAGVSAAKLDTAAFLKAIGSAKSFELDAALAEKLGMEPPALPSRAEAFALLPKEFGVRFEGNLEGFKAYKDALAQGKPHAEALEAGRARAAALFDGNPPTPRGAESGELASLRLPEGSGKPVPVTERLMARLFDGMAGLKRFVGVTEPQLAGREARRLPPTAAEVRAVYESMPKSMRDHLSKSYGATEVKALPEAIARLMSTTEMDPAWWSDHGINHMINIVANMAGLLADVQESGLVPQRSVQRAAFMDGAGRVNAGLHDMWMKDLTQRGRDLHPSRAAREAFGTELDQAANDILDMKLAGGSSFRQALVGEYGVPKGEVLRVAREIMAMSYAHSKSNVPLEALNDPALLRRAMREVTLGLDEKTMKYKTAEGVEGEALPGEYKDYRRFYERGGRDAFDELAFDWLEKNPKLAQDMIDVSRSLRLADAMRWRGSADFRGSQGASIVAVDLGGKMRALMRLADPKTGKTYLVAYDSKLALGESNIAATRISPEGDLVVGMEKGTFGSKGGDAQMAEATAEVIVDIYRDYVGSFDKAQARKLVLERAPGESKGFSEAVVKALLAEAAAKEAKHPGLSAMIAKAVGITEAPVPVEVLAEARRAATEHERARFEAAPPARLSARETQAVRRLVSQGGVDVGKIDFKRALAGARDMTLKESDLLMARGASGEYVYIPLGRGLSAHIGKTYVPVPTRAGVPVGELGVLSGNPRVADITVGKDGLRVLAIPKETYLAEWTKSVYTHETILERLWKDYGRPEPSSEIPSAAGVKPGSFDSATR